MYFSALFVISEEMLTNPRPYADESSEWTFDRFWNPGQTKKKKMDYFGFFVLIAGDVNAFVNVVSDFFTKQLLFETEEAENALMFVLFSLSLSYSHRMEKLMLFVIRKLGRTESNRLVGMVKHQNFGQSKLRDLRISRSFNSSFHNKVKAPFRYSCSVISRGCWTLPSSQIISLPPAVVSQQNQLQRFFKKAYRNRHLNTIANEGSVQLTVTLRGESRRMELSIMEFVLFNEISKNRSLLFD